MAKEIERKFLVDITKLPKKLPKKYIIKQGYFKTDDSTVRVRIINQKAFLTIKGRRKGISRSEFEYEIPMQDALDMQKEFCKKRFVHKTRYFIKYKNHTWELDIFEGNNKGLVLAEIEFKSENEKFKLPRWILEDVSYDKRYNNSNLAKKPFKEWNND